MWKRRMVSPTGAMAVYGLSSEVTVQIQMAAGRQLTSDPEMMLRLLENPFIQSRLSNPDLMTELITDNPLKQEAIQKILEISHVLNAPEMLQFMLQLARSLTTVREIMENPSQALSFLASVLGGGNTSPQVCRDPLDLMLREVSNQAGGKPFASLRSNQPHLNTRRTPSPQACSSRSSVSDCTTESGHGADPDLGRGASVAVSAAIKSSLHQIMKQLVQNILRVPGVRSVQRSLGQNPHLGAQTLPKSPATSGKPPTQPLPTFCQQIWHPEGLAAMQKCRRWPRLSRGCRH
uniref:Uncharacterized protein n=1 Tax=Pelusios castaneus TaxID=367368 RepID=A0A8C8REF3_9SAUR